MQLISTTFVSPIDALKTTVNWNNLFDGMNNPDGVKFILKVVSGFKFDKSKKTLSNLKFLNEKVAGFTCVSISEYYINKKSRGFYLWINLKIIFNIYCWKPI